MSKKKIQHKGKPKHATEQSEDIVFRKSSQENVDEEYTTVVDFETDKKYKKRLVENNWAKYEAPVADFECDVEPKTGDFSSLIKTASSDYSHFQFNSEKLWKTDTSVPTSEIFNLDLDLLSSGLACVPFYERIGLDQSELSEEEIKRFDKEAADSWVNYNSIREKKAKKTEADVSKLQDKTRSTLEELFPVKEEQCVGDKETVKSPVPENGGSKTVGKPKLFLTENDENLEDWLDSVLDD